MKTVYLIEAWALGMFMVSACFFTAVFELPGSPLHAAIEPAWVRRWLIGCAMGLTAIALIYSGWGRRSGALMNPALTLSFLYLGKISPRDALGYIIAQFVGSTVAMQLLYMAFPGILARPEINYIQTLPGTWGSTAAFLTEVLLSFLMVLMVLYSSNNSKTAPYTGVFAGLLVMLFITLAGPVSGMSINPARTFASAFVAGSAAHWALYLFAPTIGMVAAAVLWRRLICINPHFECRMSIAPAER